MSTAPRSLKADADALTIEWSDGATHRLTWRKLRDACPCATCLAQPTTPPKPASLLPVITQAEAQPLKATAVRPVGNYAYAIHFSDGHSTGIYSLKYLRELGSEGERGT